MCECAGVLACSSVKWFIHRSDYICLMSSLSQKANYIPRWDSCITSYKIFCSRRLSFQSLVSWNNGWADRLHRCHITTTFWLKQLDWASLYFSRIWARGDLPEFENNDYIRRVSRSFHFYWKEWGDTFPNRVIFFAINGEREWYFSSLRVQVICTGGVWLAVCEGSWSWNGGARPPAVQCGWTHIHSFSTAPCTLKLCWNSAIFSLLRNDQWWFNITTYCVLYSNFVNH